MRSIIGFLIGILLSVNCFSQQCFPDSIVSKIVDELVIKDHLTFVVNLQDSTLRVYHHSDSVQQVEIKTYKVRIENDKMMIDDLKLTVKLQEDQISILKQEARKQRWKNFVSFLKGLGTGLTAALIYIIVQSIH